MWVLVCISIYCFRECTSGIPVLWPYGAICLIETDIIFSYPRDAYVTRDKSGVVMNWCIEYFGMTSYGKSMDREETFKKWQKGQLLGWFLIKMLK